MSKSTRQTLVPALPDELAVLEGRKIRTVRWDSSSVGIKVYHRDRVLIVSISVSMFASYPSWSRQPCSIVVEGCNQFDATNTSPSTYLWL